MYRRILVPVDGSDTARLGLSEAIRLAKEQSSRMCLLHVLSAEYLNTVLLSGVYTADMQERIREQAQQILQSAATQAQEAGVDAETQLLEQPTSQIGEGIVQVARRWQADLIVMGTHGRRGFDRVMMGSDAEYVARHTPVPLLLLRNQAR